MTLTRYWLPLTVAFALAGPAAAQTPASSSAALVGTWNLQVQGDHVVPTALVIKQTGATLEGTLMLQGGDVTLTGSLTGKVVTLSGSVTATQGHMPAGAITLTGTLTDEGTLNGEWVSPRGTRKYSAEKLRSRPGQTAAPTSGVAGAWNMAISMGGQTMQVALTLAVEGTTVVGTLSADHSGTMAVRGTWTNGVLSMTTGSTPASTMTYTGSLNPDGTLGGTLTSPAGELPWTAARVKK